MNSDRFKDLLDRYLADRATREERDELMAMVSQGQHDDQTLGRIKWMLEGEQVDHSMDEDKARKILKGILSIEQQSAKEVRLKRSTSFRWYAAAATLLLVMSVGWWLQRVEPVHEQVATSAPAPSGPAVFAGKQFVELPDGSTVILNEDSRLSYEQSFGDSLREVRLTGEGYFNVMHDAEKPFTVVTGNITTRVLGTSFNVTAYPDQQQVQVTVTRGKVQVNNDQRLLGIITPDQQISVNTITYDFVQRNVKSEQAITWQSQYLILDDVDLEDAAKTIAQKYDVRVVLSNDALKGCRISATFLKGEDLEQVLTVVSGVVQATYSIDVDGNVTIDGKGCL